MINIPDRQWTAFHLPNDSNFPLYSGAKHINCACNPNDRRVYMFGGDYNAFSSSYVQAVLSLSLEERLANPSNENAGWRMDYPHCGGAPPQPKHPDYIGWQWNQNTQDFWFVPGTQVGANTNCAGETAPGVSDPNFLWWRVMRFNPVSKTWIDQAAGGAGAGKTWHCVFDPVKNRILQTWYHGGNGSHCIYFDIASNTWAGDRQLGPKDAVGGEVHLEHCYLAADHRDRYVYGISSARLVRFSMDLPTKVVGGFTVYALEDMGASPAGSDTEQKCVFDPVNRLLIQCNNTGNKVFAYHVDTKVWEDLGTVADNGTRAAGTVLFYDVANNCVGWFGQNGQVPASTAYLYLYRYAASTVMIPHPPGDLIVNSDLTRKEHL